MVIVITFSLFQQLHLKGNYYIYTVSLKSALVDLVDCQLGRGGLFCFLWTDIAVTLN